MKKVVLLLSAALTLVVAGTLWADSLELADGTVLEGITRRTVRELCDELDIPFAFARITPEALRDADEVFLSSTAGGIMPVSRIDDRILGNGRPGPLSTRLRDLYWRKHEQGWHGTPVDYDSP